MNIIFAVGTRPNFVKVASLIQAADKFGVNYKLVHTGQHYDKNMSGVFFDELGIDPPDSYLNVGRLTITRQEQEIKNKFVKLLQNVNPDFVVVVGDVRSTLAIAEATKEKGIKLAHVEAGLRCFDDTLPEEDVRRKVDRISDISLVSEMSAVQNLKNEKINTKIYFVGNVAVDTLKQHLKEIRNKSLNYHSEKYAVATLHRQGNVDSEADLKECFGLINYIANNYIKVILPIHPRTQMRLNKYGINISPKVHLSEPLGYLDFQRLIYFSNFVITDSGTIEEETTFIKKPCLTIRPNTERPITVTVGTNTICGRSIKLIDKKIKDILRGRYKKGRIPKFWDGKTSDRIIRILKKGILNNLLI